MTASELRIGIFSNTLLSGGTEKQLIYLANMLANKYLIFIYVLHGNKVDLAFCKKLQTENIQVVLLKGNVYKKTIKLYNLFKEDKLKLLFTFLTLPNLIGGFVARTLNIPMISSIRNSKLPVYKWVIESIVNNFLASQTTFNNYAAFKSSSPYYFDKCKIRVIHNLIKDITGKKQKIYSKDSTILSIVTIGRFVEQKDYETALKCINVLCLKGYQVKYTIIGYGKLESKIYSWIREYRLNEIVDVVLRPRNLETYLEKADIYLCTSKFEGLSNSIMEAMIFELPIVATKAGDNEYMVKSGYNGFLTDICDYDALAEMLEILIKSKTMRYEFGKKSKMFAIQQFGETLFTKKYDELIKYAML